MDKWTEKLGKVVDCIQSKQYFESLKSQTPQKSTELVKDEVILRNSILYKLTSYGDFNLPSRIVQVWFPFYFYCNLNILFIVIFIVHTIRIKCS